MCLSRKFSVFKIFFMEHLVALVSHGHTLGKDALRPLAFSVSQEKNNCQIVLAKNVVESGRENSFL